MKYSTKFLGLKIRNASKFKLLATVLGWLMVWAAGALGLAWCFMHLWAWYVPVLWADAPILGYWHSLVTMLLLGAFLRRGSCD